MVVYCLDTHTAFVFTFGMYDVHVVVIPVNYQAYELLIYLLLYCSI